MSRKSKSRTRRSTVEPLERRDLLAVSAIIPTQFQASAGMADTAKLGTVVLVPKGPVKITIKWGDGSATDTTTGQLIPTGLVDTFEIQGTHTYSAANTYFVSLTVADSANSENAIDTAIVSPATLAAAPNSILNGVATVALSNENKGNPVTVANFLDPVATDQATGYTALINWGDGQSSAGKVGGAKGVFSVTGDHTYTTVGTYPITVTIVGYGQNLTVDGGTAKISAPSSTTTTTTYAFAPIAINQQASTVPSVISVTSFKDYNTKDTANDFSAVINWGDGDTSVGTIQSTGIVPASGTASAYEAFTISSDYAYVNPGTYTVSVSLTNLTSGQTGSASGAANIVNTAVSHMGNAYAFSIALAPIPSNGPASAQNVTNTNRPTFSGTAPPYAIVSLTANAVGIDAPLALGQTVANGAGQWTLGVGPLADGVYDITPTVTPPGGAPAQPTNATGNTLDQFTIDTTTPKLTALKTLAGKSQIVLTLEAGASGMNQADLLNTANYTLSGPKVAPFHPASVTIAGGAVANAPWIVTLNVGGPANSHTLIRDLSINALGITSGAGIALELPANLGETIPLSTTRHRL